MMQEEIYRSGELARLSGVSTDTLRHYERIGVLARPPRASNGYRVYSPASLHRVLAVQNALRAGFSLAELTRIFGQRDRGGAPCRLVHSLAGRKLRDLDEQIRGLQDLRLTLAKVTRDWGSCLRKTPPGKKAYLLESLAKNGHLEKNKEFLRRKRKRNS